MSTTAVVTPYDPETERRRNELAVKEEKAIAKVRGEARKNRLSCAKMPLGQPMNVGLLGATLRINTTSFGLVKKAAETLGYSVVTTERGKTMLRHPDTSLVELSKTKAGKIVLSSPKQDLHAATLIVREFTATQIYRYHKSIGMTVQAKRTDNGEITIEAHTHGKQTAITTDIRKDGVAVVDVSGLKGKGCQEIINGITRAIEGTQIDTARKAEFFVEADTEERLHV